MKERQAKVIANHHYLSKRSRAFLLKINLSSCYVKLKPESEDVVTLMNEIRELYAVRPFQGYRRMTLDLKDMGYEVNRKKVYRLMKLMGLMAIYPKKNLSKRNQAHKVYPYLLKQHPPSMPHDAHCIDITYIKVANGFVYLTALVDVVSRCVTGFNVSTSLDTESCLMALEMAINAGYRPKILNSDQGCQFTSQEWLYNLSLLKIQVSMDGKGRALDNIPIERFWRTIKYEEVYLKTYESVGEAKRCLGSYIDWYNHKRRHSGINNHRPYEVMIGQAQASQWPFMTKPEMPENKEIQACGYVEKSATFPRDPQGSTTTIIKQHKVKLMTNLSSKIAA